MSLLDDLEIAWPTEEGLEEEEGVRWTDDWGQPVTYPDWFPGETRVVSGPYGPATKSRFPGRRFATRYQARAHWEAKARIVEEYRIPGRWIFRIKDPGALLPAPGAPASQGADQNAVCQGGQGILAVSSGGDP